MQAQHPSYHGNLAAEKHPQETRTPERSQQTVCAAVRPVATPTLSPRKGRDHNLSTNKKRSLLDLNEGSAAQITRQHTRSPGLLSQPESFEEAARKRAALTTNASQPAVVQHEHESATPPGSATHPPCQPLPPLLPGDEVCPAAVLDESTACVLLPKK